jgi:hypothetical protein
MSSDSRQFGVVPRRSRQALAPDRKQRVRVLKETLGALDTPAKRQAYHEAAKANFVRWRAAAAAAGRTGPRKLELRVVSGDWGDVTLAATREFGTTFAVLNMANERWPGGSYWWGSPAQEENMFRRSDCHFALTPDMFSDPRRRTYYSHEMQALINGANGVTYLDTDAPRVCIRGGEKDEYYPWYALEQVFPFFELRSAAVSLRGREASRETDESMRKRIDAQLDTLILANVRHVILSAFGCGSFFNSPETVAQLYRVAIAKRRDCFDVIIFAIYTSDDGPSSENYAVFRHILTPPRRSRTRRSAPPDVAMETDE